MDTVKNTPAAIFVGSITITPANTVYSTGDTAPNHSINFFIIY